jgi:carboxyl-terminal processing protease
MRGRMRQLGLLALGVFVGVMIALNFPAAAQTGEPVPLPIAELRAFAEVFGRIKSDYVEPVDDRKLITQAISGMLAGLDPHSGYLDKEEFREMQVGTRGEFGGLGIEVGMEDGFVRWCRPSTIRRHRAPASSRVT